VLQPNVAILRIQLLLRDPPSYCSCSLLLSFLLPFIVIPAPYIVIPALGRNPCSTLCGFQIFGTFVPSSGMTGGVSFLLLILSFLRRQESMLDIMWIPDLRYLRTSVWNDKGVSLLLLILSFLRRQESMFNITWIPDLRYLRTSVWNDKGMDSRSAVLSYLRLE
jgi:hypothetical protein